MLHFMQLLYQQFHLAPSALSMLLSVVRCVFCFFLVFLFFVCLFVCCCLGGRGISLQHCSVFSKQSLSRHQHISLAFLGLNFINMMSVRRRPAVGSPSARRRPAIGSMPCLGGKLTMACCQPTIGSMLCLGGKLTMTRYRPIIGSMQCLGGKPTSSKSRPPTVVDVTNPVRHAGVHSFMAHFMQLLY